MEKREFLWHISQLKATPQNFTTVSVKRQFQTIKIETVSLRNLSLCPKTNRRLEIWLIKAPSGSQTGLIRTHSQIASPG